MPRKPGLTHEQHTALAAEIHAMEAELHAACKVIIEAFGWSSPLGRTCEKMVLSGNPFERLRLENIFYDYDGHQESEHHPYQDGRPRFGSGSIHTPNRLAHRLTHEQHHEIAPVLRKWGRRCTSLYVQLANAYGKRNLPARTIARLGRDLGKIRSALDGHYCRDFPREHAPYSPYYGKPEPEAA